MKRLITICAVVGLMLSATGVSWANLVNVSPPPDAPEWWNVECQYYAYGWWEDDLIADSTGISPPDNATHWATTTNFLKNTDFTAGVAGNVVSINLGNEYRDDFYKEIYIYLRGTTTSTKNGIESTLATDDGIFTGSWGGSIGGGLWHYVVEGVIDPQPECVYLTVTVPGLAEAEVTDIWVGENCLPEPATIALLGLGSLSLLRVRRKPRA